MSNYEAEVRREMSEWEQRLFRRESKLAQLSRNFSRTVNRYIPDKVQQAITAAIKGMIESIRYGVSFTPRNELHRGASLREMDRHASAQVSKWTKWASAEGAGTGMGGFKLSLVDFPALLSIKMKMLSDLCYLYGFDPEKPEERFFMLHIFQLAYANDNTKFDILDKIKRWDEVQTAYRSPETAEFDWQSFQQDYRDSLDFRKMLQMIPGFGAIVGAWANFDFVKDLGDTAIHCYRIRILDSPDRTLPAGGHDAP